MQLRNKRLEEILIEIRSDVSPLSSLISRSPCCVLWHLLRNSQPYLEKQWILSHRVHFTLASLFVLRCQKNFARFYNCSNISDLTPKQISLRAKEMRKLWSSCSCKGSKKERTLQDVLCTSHYCHKLTVIGNYWKLTPLDAIINFINIFITLSFVESFHSSSYKSLLSPKYQTMYLHWEY